MLRNVVWLHKLLHQHMRTKSALIPGVSIYDVSPDITNAQPLPPAIAPTIAPAPITPRLTRKTAPRIFTLPSIAASDDSDDDNDDVPVPPPASNAPFDMHDTNAALTPRLPSELPNLEIFTIQKQVIRVTLHYLHMIIIIVKMSYLLILIKNLAQILRLLVMMSSFVMLIYQNMTVIPNLLLKLY
jgi:hypothetical protein